MISYFYDSDDFSSHTGWVKKKCDLRRLVKKWFFFVQLSCRVFFNFFWKFVIFFGHIRTLGQFIDKHFIARHFMDRDFMDRHFMDRYYMDGHFINRHFKDRHFTDRHFIDYHRQSWNLRDKLGRRDISQTWTDIS